MVKFDFIGWVKPLKRVWPYGLALLILAASILETVRAQAPSSVNDDCRRIMPDCQIEVAAADTAEARQFKAAAVLALTDYQHVLSYKVEFQGQLESSTDTNGFIALAAQTLADSRGWLRAGYVFNRVQVAAQADFTLVLIQAELLNGIPGCDSNWSCRSGRNVYINENRWNGATAAWNGAGGGLRDYRHMVINHEVGHFLGHGHYHCGDSPSNLAPVMQQQSIDLEGCKFNPWPLAFEIDGV